MTMFSETASELRVSITAAEYQFCMLHLFRGVCADISAEPKSVARDALGETFGAPPVADEARKVEWQ